MIKYCSQLLPQVNFLTVHKIYMVMIKLVKGQKNHCGRLTNLSGETLKIYITPIIWKMMYIFSILRKNITLSTV